MYDIEQRVKDIQNKIDALRGEGKKICVSASFQSSSAVIIHIVSSVIPGVDVLFIDTGYHFPETWDYIRILQGIMKFSLVIVRSEVSKQEQIRGSIPLYGVNPELCCYYNKVMPMREYIKKYDVWISGVRRDQTLWRIGLGEFEETHEGILRYHPLLEWSYDDIMNYLEEYGIPLHPLEEKYGIRSIGCMPCTYIKEGGGRELRWHGIKNKECGLHIHLIKK